MEQDTLWTTGKTRTSMPTSKPGARNSWLTRSSSPGWTNRKPKALASKKQAKQFAKCLHHLKGLPWKIAILVDSTIQHRASLHPENTKKFNHGNGYVIGHQWTNIILVIIDILIPLPPIPFYSQAYCREQGLDYQSEHDRVVDYLTNFNLEDYIGSCDPRDEIGRAHV